MCVFTILAKNFPKLAQNDQKWRFRFFEGKLKNGPFLTKLSQILQIIDWMAGNFSKIL